MADDGQWVTINGQHILIREGENPMTAYIRHLGKLKNQRSRKLIEGIKKDTKDIDKRKEANKIKEAKEEIRKQADERAKMTDEEIVSDDISKILEDKYKMTDKFIAFGDSHGTGGDLSLDDLTDYYAEKGAKQNIADMEHNPQKYAKEYYNFVKKIPDLKKEMLEKRKKGGK